MKKSLTILALCLYSIMNAQDLTDWQVGINLNPFIFSRIANNVISDKNNNNLPNGFGFGLTLEKNWNDNWGIKTGLEFSTQTQKYSFDCPCDNDFESKVKYTYYKTPIAIQYQFPVSSESYLNFNQGLQVSFLNDYQYIREDNYQKFVTTNEYYQSFFYANPEYNQKINNKVQFFNKTLIGIIGSVGIKTKLSDKFTYSTSIRYEYDFTSSDKVKDVFINNDGKSNNFRIGLEFGLQYHFSIGDRFDKSPHKL